MRVFFLAFSACPLAVFSFAPHFSESRSNGVNFLAASPDIESEAASSADTATTTPYRRRERYAGRYPRNFKDKYKERSGDEETINKVLAKGITPAGTHVPIMVNECLHYMGLDAMDNSDTNDIGNSDDVQQLQPLLVVDCTLGYGGHSSYILKNLVNRKNDGSRLIAFDQDSVEIKKTEERLRQALKENSLLNHHEEGDSSNQTTRDDADLFTAVNQNFQTLGTYLASVNQMETVTSLLADLGLSSMQIDDNDRGFTYKRSGPLDMRMDPERNSENAYELLKRLRVKKLKSILKENSDEEFATEIAEGLIGKGAKIPETTLELAERVRIIVQPVIEKQNKNGMNKNQIKKMKKQLDSTVARVMQAIRIEVNGEFEVLEKLLDDVPKVLAPGGKAVFLTFHSGEDRRVKKAFKSGFKSGIYSAWSRDVVRPSQEERRNNPRSSCCKLRWVIRSEEPIVET
mmetsp:Transcript_7517/g.17046  ORF Transcript_7517/g.17046 Transcript_7517/m.17046 type:complete len:459 (+) Transcript_7517:126-1502(+)